MKTIILIPYRNRKKHLDFFVKYSTPILKKHIPNSCKTVYLNLPENDPKVRKPDINLARTILDWYPKITLERGLKKTIDYFYNSV